MTKEPGQLARLAARAEAADIHIGQLLDQIGPWSALLRADKIQRDARLLDDEPLNQTTAISRIVDMVVHQSKCDHSDRKAVGHTPMGSFTMTTFECQRCGKRWNDD